MLTVVGSLAKPPHPGWALRVSGNRHLDALARQLHALHRRDRQRHAAQMAERAERIVQHHLRETRNGAYRRLVEQCGVSAETFRFSQWPSLPVIDKAFLRSGGYAECAAVQGPLLITETSGSTASAVTIPHTPRSARRTLGDNFLRALLLGGVPPDCRHWGIEHQLHPEHLSGSHLSFCWLRTALPGQVLVTGTHQPLQRQLKAARRWRPECIASAPAFLVRLALELAPLELRPRWVLYGGAALDPVAKLAVERTLAPQRIIAFYPTTDAGAIGVSPADDGVYRCFAETHLVEVVGPDGRHVAEGQEGELVVTVLDSLAAPLIRYRVGDTVRYLGVQDNRVLVCGITRKAEIPLGASLLPYADLAAWTPRLQRIEPAVVGVQLARRRSSCGRDQAVIRVATTRPSPQLAGAARALVADFPQVRHEIATGELPPPIVEMVSPNLALQGRWKLPPYVDEAR